METTAKKLKEANENGYVLIGTIGRKPLFADGNCIMCEGGGWVEVQDGPEDYRKEWCRCIYGDQTN